MYPSEIYFKASLSPLRRQLQKWYRPANWASGGAKGIAPPAFLERVGRE